MKVKCIKRQEFVIGGWTEPGGARAVSGGLAPGLLCAGPSSSSIAGGSEPASPSNLFTICTKHCSHSNRSALRFASHWPVRHPGVDSLGKAGTRRRSRFCRLDGRWFAPSRCPFRGFVKTSGQRDIMREVPVHRGSHRALHPKQRFGNPLARPWHRPKRRRAERTQSADVVRRRSSDPSRSRSVSRRSRSPSATSPTITPPSLPLFCLTSWAAPVTGACPDGSGKALFLPETPGGHDARVGQRDRPSRRRRAMPLTSPSRISRV